MASTVKSRSTSEASDKSESQSNSTTWPGPRKVTLQRNAAGFGFTLRHFIVYPPESAVAELSRQEGVASGDDRNKKRPKITALEPMDTIFVKHVKPEGAAENAGLSTGDRIVSVNGESVTGKTYTQVVGLIQSSDSCLKLLVVPREEDILQVAYPSSAYKAADGQPESQHPQSEKDSQSGGRSGIYDPASSNSPCYPSPIHPVGKAEEAHDTVILHPEPDLISHQARHKTEMVLAVGAKPIKTSTPVYDNWATSRDAAVDSRSTPPTGSHSDIAGRTGYHGQSKQAIDSRYGYQHSRPTSGISVASSTSSADSGTSGQKTGRTFKITSIFSSQNRAQSRREETQRAEAGTHRVAAGNELQSRPSQKAERPNTDSASNTAPATSRNISHQKSISLDHGPVVRLRTGKGPNDYITLTGQRRGDINSRVMPRQSNSMDNLVYGSEAQVEVKTSNSGQVSSSYDNLHLSGANGTEWEVRSGSQARISPESKTLGSDSQVNRQDTVTRRYYRSKQTETSTTTTNDFSVNSANEAQGYKEVADPHMRDLFMRQARHQRDRRGYEKKEASLSSSKSADSIRYIDGRPTRSNTVSVADTRSPVSPTERRYSQFPERNGRIGYPYNTETGQRYESSQEQLAHDGRSYQDRKNHSNEPAYQSASSINTVKIIGLDGNVQTTNVSDAVEDTNSHSNSDLTTEEEPASPTRVQDRISYWHKKSMEGSSSDATDSPSWRRGHNPHNPDNPNPNPNPNPNSRYRITAHVPLPGGSRDKPPVPKRDSSRGRVRERNMERERQHERKMYERHRSKSYDRSAQRSAAWFRSARRQTTDDMSVDSFTSDGAVSLASSRKESTASSISDGCSLDDDYPPGTRQRLVRRTSYLRATLSDEEEEGNKDVSSVADTTSLSSMSAHGGESCSPVVLRRNVTPRRNPSINKLKNIFGEGTPVIVEAVHHKPGASGASRTGQAKGGEDSKVTKEGPANIKVELKEWKRASDRSWKPVWMVLKTQTMYLLKEKREASVSPSTAEDHPISIKASMVDIAYDYTKKKNVFRLSTGSGSEYLIQVSDTKTMLSWITAIQANLTPGGDLILSADIIMRKTQQHDASSASQSSSKHVLSPPNSRKKGSRSPSPGLAQPAKKQSTGLAGKMKHKMKKKGGGASAGSTWGQPTAEELRSLTFGVPLEKCTPSETNEFVPMFVDICCNIVEEVGLETVGIYRVPGNTAGVSYLQEDLKDGPEEAHLADSRWRDVNVVSSLLKMFFRKLPNPLVPADQYKDFISANRCKDPAERMWALRRQIHNLPDHHYETFKCLAGHLRMVSQNSEVNKMEVRNLAIVFGPTLIRSGDNSMVTMVTDMSDQCCIIESIIQHCEWFFSDDVESQQAVPSDAMPETELMSSDASELLSKARKDDQSGESGSDSSKGKDINAMELMSSVISAANRKLKGRSSKKHAPNPEDYDGTEYGFSGKNGETEVKVRAIRNQTSDKTTDEEDLTHPGDSKQRTTVSVMLRRDSQSSVETHSESNFYDAESLANAQTYAAARQQLHSQRGMYGQYGSRGRTFAGPSDPGNRASTSAQGAVARTQKPPGPKPVVPDKDWKSEFARERERIEREHQKAVRDYEKEEATNVEELYRSRDYLREISAVSNKIADFASQGYRDEDSKGGHRRPGRSVDSESLLSDFSASSSNNNNTLHAARSDPVFNTRLEIRESASESESDFVQAMKATFDERLQKVVHQESEDDKLSDKSSASSKAARGDRRTVDGVYTATPYQRQDDQEAYRVRTGSGTYMRNLRQITHRTPTGGATNGAQPVSLTSRFNELSVAPQPEGEAKKKSASTPNSTTSSPTRNPRPARKTSRIEVTLTLEKKGRTSNETLPSRGNTPSAHTPSTQTPSTQTPSTQTPSSQTPSTQPPAKGKAKQEPPPKKSATPSKKNPQGGAKDTLSIKEQHRENRRRRHTVGGGRDAPEYRKIMEYNLNKANEPPRKPSAFDRLKPFGKPAKESQPQNMKSWMDSERIRTNSSPNLLASVASSTSRPNSVANPETAKLSLPTRKDGHPQKFSYV